MVPVSIMKIKALPAMVALTLGSSVVMVIKAFQEGGPRRSWIVSDTVWAVSWRGSFSGALAQ